MASGLQMTRTCSRARRNAPDTWLLQEPVLVCLYRVTWLLLACPSQMTETDYLPLG